MALRLNQEVGMNQIILNYRKKIQSSYVKVAFVGIILISIVVGLSVKNYIDFRDSLIEREQMQALTIAQSVARILTDFIDNKVEDVQILNELISDQIDKDGLENYKLEVIKPILQNYIEVQNGDVFVIEWLTPDGIILDRFLDTSKVKVDRESLYDATVPTQLNETYVGKATEGEDGKLYLDILEPVEIDGEPFGIIRFVISLEHLYDDYIRGIRAGDKGYASLKDSNGILIMHPSQEDIGQDVMTVRKATYPEYDWSELESIVELQKQGKSGVGIYHSVWSYDEVKKRVKKFNGYHPARIGDDFWIVNVSMDYRELVDIVNKHLYTSMVMVGGIPLMFILVSVYVLNLKRNLDQLQIEHNYVDQLNLLNKELEEDIEQRKHLEYELKQSRRRFRTLFNAGVDLTFVLKKNEVDVFTITDINDIACERLNETRETLTNSDFMMIDKTIDPDQLENLFKEMSKRGLIQYETELTSAEGISFPVEINGHSFEFQESDYIMLIARDITERLTQKEELERHRAMAIYKNRMAAVGEMVANIAHQWRQPLSSLNLMLSNLEDAHETNTLDDVYFDKQILKSRNVIQKMSLIIDEFRYFFNPKGQKEYFDIEESLKQVEDMLHDRMRIESVYLEILPEENLGEVFGYPNQLSQVLLNLLSNALDAFGDTSNSEAIGTSKRIKVGVNDNGERIELKVTDNAGGIENDKLSKLFEPYFTTKSDQGGTGIGLYMSKMIVESKFSGEISVEHTGEGLCFTINLPKRVEGDM